MPFLAVRRMELGVSRDELLRAFKETLGEAGFTIVEDEETGSRFKVVGVNRRRRSMLSVTLFSLVGGYLPRKRVAVELVAQGDEAQVNAVLRCVPYIETVDMEVKAESPGEIEMCESLARVFGDKILEKLDLSPESR